MKKRATARRGSILVLVAIMLVVLLAFVAFAIDLGAIADARAQCQNAADAAAVAGARALNGLSAGNLASASASAMASATSNSIFGTPLAASEVTVQHGAYHYNAATQTFTPQFPPTAPDNYSLTQVTITHQLPTFFAGIFGIASNTIQVTATAVHAPRDIAIVLDYSGSMNNESDLWNCESYLGSANNSSNNSDPVFPQFGPYQPAFSPNAQMQCTSSDPRVGKCNVTTSVLGISAMVNDFYQNTSAAFAPAPPTITNTQPGGDSYVFKKGSTTVPAVNWQEIQGNATTPPTALYTGNGGNAYGYTQGPGYWGKTFFLWPPDPRPAYDWRKKFFFNSDGVTPLNNNTHLWDNRGNWQDPPGNYVINYRAILAWIKSAPSIFPASLRGGRILYYSAIPDDVPATAYIHTTPNSAITSADQRFWKEYIDFALGVWRDPFGNINAPGTPACSYGPDFACGTSATVSISGPDKLYGNGVSYIGPTDNPLRPRHRLWFSPMTMIQYMADTGLLPGTAHDISLVAAKLGVTGALQDIQNNHPNDQVALIMFNRPTFRSDPAGIGRFDLPRVTMGGDYTALLNALWYPNNSAQADVRPWDANGMSTPRVGGDYTGNTATDYGLMLAYNQFSGNASLQSSGAGGWGRKGAQRIVILETDGMANVASSAGLVNAGPYQSYYATAPMGSVSISGASASSSALAVGTRLCALDTSSPPGYAQARKPVLIHCLAFGAIFEPTASGSEQANAVDFLQQLSTIGGTTFPASASDPVNGYKWCIGTLSQRQDELRQAFTKIIDDTVTINLIK